MIKQSQEYQLIAREYEGKITERSGVPLINHIDEGIEILEIMGASEQVSRAYCLHPIFQGDKDLERNAHLASSIDPYTLMLAMEYRNVANAYLSRRTIGSLEEIALSPLEEVNDMLRADKIQNFKDFMAYHYGTHKRSNELFVYFKNWFKRLGLNDDIFSALTRNPHELPVAELQRQFGVIHPPSAAPQ